jgi:hypothetical protein
MITINQNIRSWDMLNPHFVAEKCVLNLPLFATNKYSHPTDVSKESNITETDLQHLRKTFWNIHP